MRQLLLGIVVAGLASQASAQQTVQPPPVPGPIKLELSLDQVQLIVATLGQIGCPTVQQWTTCQLAVDTLKSVRAQVEAQHDGLVPAK